MEIINSLLGMVIAVVWGAEEYGMGTSRTWVDCVVISDTKEHVDTLLCAKYNVSNIENLPKVRWGTTIEYYDYSVKQVV